MKIVTVEDEYSIIEVAIIKVKPTWVQVKQMWKDDGDEDNIIIVSQNQVNELIAALGPKCGE